MKGKSESMNSRLVCWLPVVDEVRTRIYGLSREIGIPDIPQQEELINESAKLFYLA